MRTTPTGIFSCGDWFSNSPSPGNKAFINAYIAKYGGTPDKIDPGSAEAFATGELIQEVAKKTGKVDNATIIKTLHSGILADGRGQPQLEPVRGAHGQRAAHPVGERDAVPGVAAERRAARADRAAEAALGWLGSDPRSAMMTSVHSRPGGCPCT